MAAFERNRVGIGYVPQAREVFPSLTVEENLTVAGRPGRWTLERVYELFPGSPSGGRTWATRFPAASSRCSRSDGR